jgi:hypothetical protein
VFQYLADVPLSQTTFFDDVTSDHLQEAMVTDGWIGPPDDDAATFPGGPLRHPCVVASSFLAGHNRQMVCFSEPGTTHAWPAAYYAPHSERIIKTLSRGPDLVVLTDGHPYVYTGVHPSAMSPLKLAESVPLAHPDAAIEVQGYVFFASQSGLFSIGPDNRIEKVSHAWFLDEQWAALDPTTMRFYQHRNYLLIDCAGDVLTGPRLLAVNVADIEQAPRWFDINIQAGWTGTGLDQLYYVPDGSSTLYRFNEGSAMPYRWRSADYSFHEPKSFSCIRVRVSGDVDPIVTVRARRHDGFYFEHSFTYPASRHPWRYLPGGFRGEVWSVEISGTAIVRSVELAQSPGELTHV